MLGREKKLGENFGSEETWEAKKRPAAIFDHQEGRNPPEPEESGFEKELRLRSPKTEEFNLLMFLNHFK